LAKSTASATPTTTVGAASIAALRNRTGSLNLAASAKVASKHVDEAGGDGGRPVQVLDIYPPAIL
jgi:hypothetical protein